MSFVPHKPWGYDRRLGFGAPSTDLINATNGLLAYFTQNQCTQASFAECSTFQTQYNASGLPGSLTVDGQYGGNTQSALQNAINAMAAVNMGPAQSAPPNCFTGVVVNGENYGVVPSTPAPDAGAPTTSPTAAPSTTPTSQTVVVNQPPSTNWAPVLIAGAVTLGAAAVGYAYLKKHHRRGLFA